MLTRSGGALLTHPPRAGLPLPKQFSTIGQQDWRDCSALLVHSTPPGTPQRFAHLVLPDGCCAVKGSGGQEPACGRPAH